MNTENWENEGGSPPRIVYLELSESDMVYLMNRANLDNTARDRRILDAFRRALANGHHHG